MQRSSFSTRVETKCRITFEQSCSEKTNQYALVGADSPTLEIPQRKCNNVPPFVDRFQEIAAVSCLSGAAKASDLCQSARMNITTAVSCRIRAGCLGRYTTTRLQEPGCLAVFRFSSAACCPLVVLEEDDFEVKFLHRIMTPKGFMMHKLIKMHLTVNHLTSYHFPQPQATFCSAAANTQKNSCLDDKPRRFIFGSPAELTVASNQQILE